LQCHRRTRRYAALCLCSYLFSSYRFDILPEIRQQPFDRDELVALFPAAIMPVIALAAFVVIPYRPLAGPAVEERIFQEMLRRRHLVRHSPYPDLHDRAITENNAFASDKIGFHGYNYGIRCHRRQYAALDQNPTFPY